MNRDSSDWTTKPKSKETMKKIKESDKKSWIVEMEVTKRIEVTTRPCTEEEARDNIWEYSEDERNLEMTEWEVISIRENS